MTPRPQAPRAGATPARAADTTPVLVLHDSIRTRWPDDAAVARDLAALPSAERERVARLRRPDDRRRALLGRLLLLQGLAAEGLPPQQLARLSYTAEGKPHLPGADLAFNISHAGDLVVCALARGGRVGIDVEPVRELALDDFAGTMDAAQWRDIRAAREPSRRFLAWWTMKESVVKCQGQGLALPLAELRADAEAGWLTLGGDRWRVGCVALADDYVCHVATEQPRAVVVRQAR